METFETIIGLLFVLLPVLFKFIEKNLQKSAKKEPQSKKDIDFSDLFPEDDSGGSSDDAPVLLEDQEDIVFAGREPEQKTTVIEMPETPAVMEYKAFQPEAEGVRAARKSPLKNQPAENKPADKEKIDPKKLVIYSELMKPKFQE